MLRLSVPLISVQDLPAAIKSRSRFSSSGVQRTLGITQSFLRLQPEPAGSPRRVFLATSGTFVVFVGCDGSGGTGKPAVAYEAARSHARAAFLSLRLPGALEKYRPNSAYTQQRLRERPFSAPSGL